MTRHSPSTHQSVILMAHTAFNHPEDWAIPTQSKPLTHYSDVPPLTVPGLIKEVVLEARLVKRCPDTPLFTKGKGCINGLESHALDMRKHIQLEDSQFCHLYSDGGNRNTQEVVFNEFSPGSIIVFRCVTHTYIQCILLICRHTRRNAWKQTIQDNISISVCYSEVSIT